MSRLKQIVFIVVIVFILIIAVGQQITINQLEEKKDKLKEEFETETYEKEKKEHELENPDLQKMAEEQGYVDPDSELYFAQ